jgi:hypothetical protein
MPSMKALLTVEAVIEGGTGLVLVAFPSTVAALLLGASLDAPGALTVARVAGVTLLALVVACWRARTDPSSGAARGVAGAMALYNVGVLAVLGYAGLGLGLSGIALWPAVLVHAVMAAWCAMALRAAAARAPVTPVTRPRDVGSNPPNFLG